MSAVETRRARRSSLGRGLGALLGDVDDAETTARGDEAARMLPIGALRPSALQPRTAFDETELAELAASIGELGVLQPILVRPLAREPGHFEIIAGERRWRAAQRVPLHEVPVVVREIDDRNALHVAIVENVQRSDLNPMEEAEGYRRLCSEYAHTQESISRVVGKSRSHVANLMRLLDLPDSVALMVREGMLSMGHARALLSCPSPTEAARLVVKRQLTVRQTEALARQARDNTGSTATSNGQATGRTTGSRRSVGDDPNVLAVEQALAEATGLAVKVDPARDNAEKGRIIIRYESVEQFEFIQQRLSA